MFLKKIPYEPSLPKLPRLTSLSTTDAADDAPSGSDAILLLLAGRRISGGGSTSRVNRTAAARFFCTPASAFPRRFFQNISRGSTITGSTIAASKNLAPLFSNLPRRRRPSAPARWPEARRPSAYNPPRPARPALALL